MGDWVWFLLMFVGVAVVSMALVAFIEYFEERRRDPWE
jgi:hypothetical protein